ncbi:Uncharacterised protein [Burkholderia pseudomallei]|nr:Uncharacterised protein [Burkholderia pseudomallei]CAJ4274720.1 Uncharacterised protein [Burkholderia pseudomallei]
MAMAPMIPVVRGMGVSDNRYSLNASSSASASIQ